MNTIPAGYTLRPDRTFEREVVFEYSGRSIRETLIRTPTGRLLQVLRTPTPSARPSTPTGLNPKAQGCDSESYPGSTSPNSLPNPEGVEHL